MGCTRCAPSREEKERGGVRPAGSSRGSLRYGGQVAFRSEGRVTKCWSVGRFFPHRAKFSRSRPNAADAGPTPGRTRGPKAPHLGTKCTKDPTSEQLGPNFARTHGWLWLANLARIRPHSARRRLKSAKPGPNRPNLAELGPGSATIGPESAKCGRNRPILDALGHIWSECDQH